MEFAAFCYKLDFKTNLFTFRFSSILFLWHLFQGRLPRGALQKSGASPLQQAGRNLEQDQAMK